MPFWKMLFGGSKREKVQEQTAEPVEYKGFTIVPTPYLQGGQHQICGVVSREIGGEIKEHRFVRADFFPSKEDAVDVTLRKARQIIDEQGERIFN